MKNGKVVDELNVACLMIKLDRDLLRNTLHRLKGLPLGWCCKLWVFDESLPDQLYNNTPCRLIYDRALQIAAVGEENKSARQLNYWTESVEEKP